jgi:hypothetical protein
VSKQESFHLKEYETLREEITAKLKDRQDFNRWGLIGLAALYSYLFSNPGNRFLFWVPVAFSAAVISYLLEEHRMVAKAGNYLANIELWAAGKSDAPSGWQKYLADTGHMDSPWWEPWQRWPSYLWAWSPVPLWVVVFVVTLAFALWSPSIAPPPPGEHRTAIDTASMRNDTSAEFRYSRESRFGRRGEKQIGTECNDETDL